MAEYYLISTHVIHIQSQTERKRFDFTLTTCQSTNATETRNNAAQYFIFYFFPNFSMLYP